jgi:hypothetical protein
LNQQWNVVEVPAIRTPTGKSPIARELVQPDRTLLEVFRIAIWLVTRLNRRPIIGCISFNSALQTLITSVLYSIWRSVDCELLFKSTDKASATRNSYPRSFVERLRKFNPTQAWRLRKSIRRNFAQL